MFEFNQPVQKPKTRKKMTKVHEIISPGEKAVMIQAKKIEKKQRMIEANIQPVVKIREGSTVPLVGLPPMNTAYERLERGEAGHDKLSEWEKGNFERIFRTLDDYRRFELIVEKTKVIRKESLDRLWEAMEKDETYMGKVPAFNKRQFDEIVNSKLGDKKQLSSLTFGKILEAVQWKELSNQEVKERADKFYQSATELLRAKKDSDCLAECIKALGITRGR